jgi:heme oxygenase
MSSSKPVEPPCPLGNSINTGTKPLHTKLNKLIVGRLPLALAPQAEDPSNYVSGLLHITPIYATFETLWRAALDSPLAQENSTKRDEHSCEACESSTTIRDTSHAPDDLQQSTICPRIHDLLARVHTPELEREGALKSDIGSLTGWDDDLLREQLDSASEHPVLSDFLGHIRWAVESRPHVLLAYAWVLYMALFRGGRIIRATLERVDSDFWAMLNPDVFPEKPLQFLTFDTPREGDEIKSDFKRRLTESSENLLTASERDDIVAEAQKVFGSMLALVGELDDFCREETEDSETMSDKFKGYVGRLVGMRAGMRYRDSIAVTNERRALAKSSEKNGRAESGVAKDDAEAAH